MENIWELRDINVMEDKNFHNFVNNIGLYLNKEVSLNHEIDPGWFNKKKNLLN